MRLANAVRFIRNVMRLDSKMCRRVQWTNVSQPFVDTINLSIRNTMRRRWADSPDVRQDNLAHVAQVLWILRASTKNCWERSPIDRSCVTQHQGSKEKRKFTMNIRYSEQKIFINVWQTCPISCKLRATSCRFYRFRAFYERRTVRLNSYRQRQLLLGLLQ